MWRRSAKRKNERSLALIDCSTLKKTLPFQEPRVYVTTILDVHRKYNTLVLVAFNNDAGFVAALDKACGKFINTNNVTKKANSSSKSPGMNARI